jgi:hypothetical protein
VGDLALSGRLGQRLTELIFSLFLQQYALLNPEKIHCGNAGAHGFDE